tara:strand:- start:56 stop:673 length:618 start_codon:yes stop_codon:yes gene_type:complete
MNIQQAKIEVRKKIGKVAKDAKQEFRGYQYTSHEGVTEAVVPAMHKIGMTHTPSCESFEMHDGFAVVRVAVKFWGPDGDSEEVSAYSADKIKDGTTMGALVSYGIKTVMLKYFGLQSGDEDLEALQGPPGKMDKSPPKKAPKKAKPSGGDKEKVAALKEFIDVAAEAGVTSDQLDTRLTREGYANLDEVPLSVLTQWIEKIKESM